MHHTYPVITPPQGHYTSSDTQWIDSLMAWPSIVLPHRAQQCQTMYRMSAFQYGNIKLSIVRWYPIRSIKSGLAPRQGIRGIGTPDYPRASDKSGIVKRYTARRIPRVTTRAHKHSGQLLSSQLAHTSMNSAHINAILQYHKVTHKTVDQILQALMPNILINHKASPSFISIQ